MWPYSFVTREVFEARKDVVDRILRQLGCEVLPDLPQELTMYGNSSEKIRISERPLYRLGEQYVRICEILFTQKPFIVLEIADTWEEVKTNTMEDADPFPYDLLDDEIVLEVKRSLGLKEYQKKKSPGS